MRATCPRSHPCPLLCSDDCGDCQFPTYGVELPCGHTPDSIPWQVLFRFISQFPSEASYSHMLENLEAVKCVAQTSKRLPDCEHSATMACSRDPATFKCKEICGVTCPRAHPCPLLCSDDCGACQFPIYGVELPCGHTHDSIPWQVLFMLVAQLPFDASYSHMLENLMAVKCVAQTSKRLPNCEHSATMACSSDPTTFKCKEVCRGLTTCCSRRCTSRCDGCQKVTKDKSVGASRPLVRTHHVDHACERLLKCQHSCGLPCSSDHSCNPRCQKTCRQHCGHRKCGKPCEEPCPPCLRPCEWRCSHHSCPVVCGLVSPK